MSALSPRLRLLSGAAQRATRAYATAATAAAAAPLKQTPLHRLHVSRGAKLVPFAGYSMPITYESQPLAASHHQVRKQSGLFDVSHMLQHHISGPAALEFLHLLTPSDLQLLAPGQSTLSTFLHPVTAGIIDDLMITRLGPESFYLVTNAGCAAKDLAHLSNSLATFAAKSEVTHKVLTDRALLALQGPLAAGILSRTLLRATSKEPDLHTLKFGHSRDVETAGFGTLNIVRGGYTGEDGFEIGVEAAAAENLAIEILEVGGTDTGLIGLGARDTLRLEAGLCLYGNDLDDSTTPIEAGMKWIVGKSRVMTGGFNGAETLVRQYNDWGLVEKRRVGLVVQGSPARQGAEIHMGGEKVGQVTSGCPSPTLGWNIAMGYVKKGLHKAGTELEVIVRGKSRLAEVVRMPFVDHRYFK